MGLMSIDKAPSNHQKNTTSVTSPLRQSPFTVRFAVMLALLTTFVFPIVLAAPFIVAKFMGLPLIEYVGLSMRNFGIFILIAQTIGLFASLAIIAKELRRRDETWSTLGLRKFNAAKGLRYVLGYYGIILGLMITAAIIFTSIYPGDVPSTPDGESGGSSMLSAMGGFWPTFALTVILAPIIEEIVFRGVLFPALRRRLGVVAGIVVSSVFFTLVHLNPLQMISVLPLGIYLAIMYQRTGSIYPGMLLHASWNLLVLLIAQSSL